MRPPLLDRSVVPDLDDLDDHGDRQVPGGALDLAVNVVGPTPAWLLRELREVDLVGYPDPARATLAVAARHQAPPEECLLLAGAAEAFWLLAHVLRPRLAACVHPSFTAPEAALRAVGTPVHRVSRRPEDDWQLDPGLVPEDADLVVLGRPDNPTGRLEPPETITRLARPGRVLVVDEAFADFLPDADGLHGTVPGVVTVRSLTKLWGLAGLRVGHLLGPADLVDRLSAARQPWPVPAPSLRAAELLAGAEDERRQRAAEVARTRDELVAALRPLPLQVWASPANYLLLRSDHPDLRDRLLEHDVAVRRCETFPGLDAHYVRVAVHPHPRGREALLAALGAVLPGEPAPSDGGSR